MTNTKLIYQTKIYKDKKVNSSNHISVEQNFSLFYSTFFLALSKLEFLR